MASQSVTLMSEVFSRPRTEAVADPLLVRPIGVFAIWRLQAYGYTLAAGYAVFAIYLYHLGVWLLNKEW